MKRFEYLSHCCKRMKGHLIEHQESKLRLARSGKAAKVSAGASKAALDAEYRGKLTRHNMPWGQWDNHSHKSIQMKFLTDVMCARNTYMYQMAVKYHKGIPI